MKKSNQRLIYVFLACCITNLLYQNCAPAFQSQQVSELSSLSASASFDDFQKVVEVNCNYCHGGADSLYPGIINFKNFTTESSWLAQPNLIVAGDRANSTMYNRLTFAKGQVAETNNNMPFPVDNYPVTMKSRDAAGWVVI